MNKYIKWLTAEHGRSAHLARVLGVTRSAVSLTHTKTGRYLPPSWIPTLIELSDGKLLYSDLIPLTSRTNQRILPTTQPALKKMLAVMDRRALNEISGAD